MLYNRVASSYRALEMWLVEYVKYTQDFKDLVLNNYKMPHTYYIDYMLNNNILNQLA